MRSMSTESRCMSRLNRLMAVAPFNVNTSSLRNVWNATNNRVDVVDMAIKHGHLPRGRELGQSRLPTKSGSRDRPWRASD